MTLPDVKRPAWHEQKFWPQFLASVGALLAGGISAWKLHPSGIPQTEWWPFGVAVAGVVCVVAGGVLSLNQVRRKDDEEAEVKGPLTLTAMLSSLRSSILAGKNIPVDDKDALRITVYKVQKEELEQLVDYVGGAGAKAGARIGIFGVVGLVIRSGEAKAWARESTDWEAYVEQLVKSFFVPRDIAQTMRKEKMSFCAVPIFDKQEKVVGAMFADSPRRDFFDDERARAMIGGCTGMVSFLRNHVEAKK